MSYQPVAITLNVITRSIIMFGVPVTVVALFTGYQRPSNAAIVTLSTSVDVVMASHDDRVRQRSQLS